jgi:hypothetical protein
LLSNNTKIKIYGNIILPVGLYGYETWSDTLMDKCKLRMFENRVLRKILGLNREELREEWRKLHANEMYDLTPKKF